MTDKEKTDKIANAKNPYCPLVKLSELSTDEDYDVRKAVIKNPNCPPSILKKIYKYEDEHSITSHNMVEIIISPNLSHKDAISFYKQYKEESGLLYQSELHLFLDMFKRFAAIVSDPEVTNNTLLEIANLDTSFHFRGGDEDNAKYLKDRLNEIKKAAKHILFKRKLKGIVIAEPAQTLDEKQEELEYQQLLEKQRQEDLKEAQEELVKNLIRIKEIVAQLKEANIESNIDSLRIRIPIEELYIKVDDHFEINPNYLEYINFINFYYVPTDNLKVSHIDWSGTNISIDPQTVYKKDLSYAKFNDDNIVFKSFASCILIGTDISEEKESIGIEDAIIDETTKLPPSYRQTK